MISIGLLWWYKFNARVCFVNFQMGGCCRGADRTLFAIKKGRMKFDLTVHSNNHSFALEVQSVACPPLGSYRELEALLEVFSFFLILMMVKILKFV